MWLSLLKTHLHNDLETGIEENFVLEDENGIKALIYRAKRGLVTRGKSGFSYIFKSSKYLAKMPK